MKISRGHKKKTKTYSFNSLSSNGLDNYFVLVSERMSDDEKDLDLGSDDENLNCLDLR